MGQYTISNYVYKHQEADAIRSFGKTPKMMEFFTTHISYPYPWEKFSQTVVADFIFGGMENVRAVTLSDNTIHDSRAHLDYSSDDLVAHELAHQWFGNLITCSDWSHAWLNEGFATYFENLFTEYDRGKDAAAKKMMDYQTVLRNIDEGDRRRPTVCNRYNNPMDLFDSRIYGKGAVVLNMLREVLGHEFFWKTIKNYVAKYAFQCVETKDFKSVVEETANSNLDWFFDQWIYKSGCPLFEVTSKWDQGTRSLNLIVKQTQNIDSLTGIFQTPVDIEVWIRGNPETYRVMIMKEVETFSFPAYQQPQLVIFDKGSKILKKIRFEKSVDEWIYQIQRAADGVDRLQAIDELRWYVSKDTVMKVLSKAALEDPFWAVRQEAVWTLGDANLSNISDTLIIAYGDRDSKVRVASISSLGRFKGEKVLKVLKHAFEKDSSYSVAAAALRSLTQADTANRKKYCIEGLKYTSRNEIVRATALQLLAESRDEEALKNIWSFSGYGIEPNLRLHAIRLLAINWKERDDVLYYLFRLVDDPNFHVRRIVIEILGEIGDRRALDSLHAFLQNYPDERLEKAAREAIEKIQLANKEKK
ncbi:MAG: M1 family aminopeptidase [Bacteroidota bacterium]|nr:M1 family aminopeptidase [Bacteroidota bacterium]